MRPLLVVFARAPRLGTVKRRLAAQIGARAALRFHANTLAHMLRRLAADRRFETRLAVTPHPARGPWRHGLRAVTQGSGDLGARMGLAFRAAPRRRVAIVGCDIPDFRPADAARAFHLLRGVDAVFGPARDGGYWLVAMGGRRPAAPFARVRWSSEHALSDTLHNFAGRRVRLLRLLSDIDDIDALRGLTERPGQPHGAGARPIRRPADAPAVGA
jgi:rSAM/selenodomain-associated transferase 1